MDQALTEIDVANTQVDGLPYAKPVACDQTQNGIIRFPVSVSGRARRATLNGFP